MFGLFDGGAGVVGVVRVVLDGFVEQLLERVRCILHQLKHTQRTRSDQIRRLREAPDTELEIPSDSCVHTADTFFVLSLKR